MNVSKQTNREHDAINFLQKLICTAKQPEKTRKLYYY